MRKGEIPKNRGRLKNGNPVGDFLAAPRCGALTRKKTPCQQPRMRERSKCRLHGGKSTGPRTAAGLQAIRQAHWINGLRSERLQAECRAECGKKEEAELRSFFPFLKFRVQGICWGGPPSEWADDPDDHHRRQLIGRP